MLRELFIRDFIIVESLDLSFESGFTVFTGETGAGKSILIDALGLILGARADTDVVRNGATRAEMSATFDISSSALKWLTDQSIDTDSNEVVLRRVLDPQGRNKAYINGSPATLTQLRELGELLVDIHGQHAHQSLLKEDFQRDMLDAQGNLLPERQKVKEAWQHWQSAKKALDDAQFSATNQATQIEQLQWQVEVLHELGSQPDEWEQISQEHSRLSHGQSLMQGAGDTLNALEDDEVGICRIVERAYSQLNNLAKHDSALQNPVASLETARIALDEARADLNSYLSDLELDPERLHDVELRMRALFEAARKFHCEPEALPDLLQSCQEKLDNLHLGADLLALSEAVESAHQAYTEVAQALSIGRQKIAKSLAKNVTAAMQQLAMPGGRFNVNVQQAKPTSHGVDQIIFEVAGHEGTATKPLAKVASGGELARISLALSVLASQTARVPTLIFDEVDTGIGGAVAEIVGQLLRELGTRHQVLCVTHLPQVAARGQFHFEVSKIKKSGSAVSDVTALDQPGRIESIARMLGGIKITDTTRQHAREMLQQ
ncbi:MAG: DNA repair protein RecN [Burkholderiaceae bacterium]|nr:DNA repair protein RecN [Burkholderiaceae bacterium]